MIAVIPARQGSKRAPGKNVARIGNKTLVALTIEQAIRSKCFDDVIVTSDSQEVIDIAGQYPVSIQNRQEKFATDSATVLDVLLSTGQECQWIPETIVALLQVTAPLRTAEDIQNALDIFLRSDGRQAVVSVAETEYPIYLTMTIEKGALSPVYPEIYRRGLRKQDQDTTYRWNDAVMVDNYGNLSSQERPNLFGENPLPYVMPLERSVAIDYPFQLQTCQAISLLSNQGSTEGF